MSEFVQGIAKLDMDDFLMLWAYFLGVSTMVMAFKCLCTGLLGKGVNNE